MLYGTESLAPLHTPLVYIMERGNRLAVMVYSASCFVLGSLKEEPIFFLSLDLSLDFFPLCPPPAMKFHCQTTHLFVQSLSTVICRSFTASKSVSINQIKNKQRALNENIILRI